MPTPTRLTAPARSSPSSTKASRNVNTGTVATRMPVSDDEISRSPKVMSRNGATTWTSESTTTARKLPCSGRRAPR